MNELVTKILDIERKANEIIENEKEKLLNIDDEVEQILLERTKEMEAKEKTRIQKIIELEKEEEESKIKEIEENFSKSIHQLTEVMNTNKEKWVSEIFDKIVS